MFQDELGLKLEAVSSFLESDILKLRQAMDRGKLKVFASLQK